MPALAAPSDRDERRAERQQDREDRQQSREEGREERQDARTEQVQERRESGPRNGPVSSEESQQVEQAPAARAARLSPDDGPRLDPSERRQVREQRIEDRQQARDERIEANRVRRELRQAERPAPNVVRPRVPVVSNTPRIGTQPPVRTEVRRRAPVNWSQHWRNDRRYDWWNWRNRHRSLFNLGFYYDPFGWGYQRYNIGWRMWPSYYGSSFWLNDPWQYRLPYAPPGYRWIRYYDDAILIDTWDGRVVDVIYHFFW
jgi:hypothetical protein